jgi:hypothetical protein
MLALSLALRDEIRRFLGGNTVKYNGKAVFTMAASLCAFTALSTGFRAANAGSISPDRFWRHHSHHVADAQI